MVQKWVAPPLGSFKINTDASVNSRDKITGIGIIIRDGAGHVMASLC